MLAFKPDVRLDLSSPAIVHILYNVSKVAKELNKTIRITSGNDSHNLHMKGSRHLTDEAVDIGTKEFSADVKSDLFNKLYDKVGPRFSVLFENMNQPNEHIHIQVKKGTRYP